MGQVICACFEEGQDAGDPESQHLDALKIGAKFTRSRYLGLSTQELHMRLSDDTARLSWKAIGGDDFGEIDLTTTKTLRSKGAQGIEYIGDDGKATFECQAEDTAKRDQWLVAVNELLAFWAETPSRRPSSSLSAKGTANKDEYFKAREAEIQRREAEAAEKKKKYGAVGMKYTAQVMANNAAASK